MLFGGLRKRIGMYSFNKERSRVEQHRRMTNIQDAKRIGILYTLDEIQDYERVSVFVSELQHKHKEVKALGFVKNKNLISRFLPKLSFDFFSKKDLTWFNKPIHSTVRDFIDNDFDILIDLSIQDIFPLKYISGLSRSFCRVGRFSDENTLFYDFMIDSKSIVNIEEYLHQIKHYLTVINCNEKGI